MSENKYNNGKIYIVKNSINEDYYIGSTIQPLRKRLSDHKCDKREKSTALTHYMSQCKAKYYIELIKDFPCNFKYELECEEGRIVKEYTNNKPEIEYNKCINKYKFDNQTYESIQESEKESERRRKNVLTTTKAGVMQDHKDIMSSICDIQEMIKKLIIELKKKGNIDDYRVIQRVYMELDEPYLHAGDIVNGTILPRKLYNE